MAYSQGCHRAVSDPWCLTGPEVGRALGVSTNWVRRHFQASEWHHVSVPDSPRRRLWFYRWSDLQRQVRTNPILAGQLARAQRHATMTMSINDLRTWDFGRAVMPVPYAVGYRSLTRVQQRCLRERLPSRAFAWYQGQYWVLPWNGRAPAEWLWVPRSGVTETVGLRRGVRGSLRHRGQREE